MVLEDLYPVELLKRRSFYAFLLGISYSIIGMGAAIFLFPDDPALIAVAVTSMLMLPLLRNLSKEKEEQIQDPTPKILFKQNWDSYKIYILLFLGAFIAFAAFSMLLPKLAANFLFKNQLQMYFGSITGKAFSTGMFMELFNNNLKVLVFSFVMSLVMGGGAIFIIIWNASLWGTIFGMLAKTAAVTMGGNSIALFGLVLLIVFPHMILEASSYVLSAIAGSMLSITFVTQKFFSETFNTRFNYNLYLLLAAVVVVIIAALIESYVIDISAYQEIIRAAFA